MIEIKEGKKCKGGLNRGPMIAKPNITPGPSKPIPVRKACPHCFGMGVKERPNGETFDCPSRSCDNGFITIN